MPLISRVTVYSYQNQPYHAFHYIREIVKNLPIPTELCHAHNATNIINNISSGCKTITVSALISDANDKNYSILNILSPTKYDTIKFKSYDCVYGEWKYDDFK